MAKRNGLDHEEADDSKASLGELEFMYRLGRLLTTRTFDSLRAVFLAIGFSPSYSADVLKTLEKQRWKRLLVNRSDFKLTDAGLAAYQYSRRVIETHAVGPFDNGRESLRIGTSNRVMTSFLAPKIAAFLERRKDQPVDLKFQEDHWNETLLLLRRGQIDLAIGGVPENEIPDDLRHDAIRNPLPLVVIVSAKGYSMFDVRLLREGYEVTFDDLKDVNLCLIEQDQEFALQLLPPPRHGARILVENYASVVSLVLQQNAVGLVLDMGLPPESELLKFSLSKADAPPPRDLSVWTRKNDKLSAAAQEFVKIVRTP